MERTTLQESGALKAGQADRVGPTLVGTSTYMAALATTHLAVWLVLSSLWLAVGGSLNGIDIGLALLLAIFLCSWSERGSPAVVSNTIAGVAALLLVWVVAFVYAMALDDLSYDGQTYHSLAIIKLREGWNPFGGLLLPDDPPLTWLNHYPKAPWIWAAGIDAVFGNFQAGKAPNVVLAFAAGAAVFSAASVVTRLPIWACFVFGVLAAANPVASVQMPSFYVDGQLASLLTVMAAGGLMWLRSRSALALLITCSAAFCLVNAKFTGLVYAVLLGLAIAAIGVSMRPRRLLADALPVMACVMAIAWPGYTPYLNNMMNDDHIFHPVMGKRPIDILSHITPVAFDGQSRWFKFGRSLASETANACRNCESGRLKLPFIVRASEARGATFPDPRMGGFGPLFSGALLLAAILLAIAVASKAVSAVLPVSLVVLVGLVLINPEAWWARYVPQLWLVPLTVALFLQNAALPSLGRVVRVALLVVLMANAAFMAVIATGYAAYSTRASRAQVADLARAGPLYIPDTYWVGALQRLVDGGVVYAKRDFSAADCAEIVTVLRSNLRVCRPANAAKTTLQAQ